MAEVVVELLSKRHDRQSFSCRKDKYTEFLQKLARKHADQNISKTWVAVEVGSTAILAYVTLSMGNVLLEDVDEGLASKLPRHPIPVLHVGRLATDSRHEGRGLGSYLLRFAAEKAIEASSEIGCFALELIAEDEEVAKFYEDRGFLRLKKDKLRLYQSVETLKRAQ